MSDENDPEAWKPCRKKPLVVHVREATGDERAGRGVFTREGLTLARPDDLVMRGVEGELYPIGRDLFERTYDMVVDREHAERPPAVLVDPQVLAAAYDPKVESEARQDLVQPGSARKPRDETQPPPGWRWDVNHDGTSSTVSVFCPDRGGRNWMSLSDAWALYDADRERDDELGAPPGMKFVVCRTSDRTPPCDGAVKDEHDKWTIEIRDLDALAAFVRGLSPDSLVISSARDPNVLDLEIYDAYRE